MHIPETVRDIQSYRDLTLYHYTDEAEHPSDADFWKGVVTDGDEVVARSFRWAPTYVVDTLPEDLMYTPLMEGTILRFYMYQGKPMVSTHKQINIVGKKSRVSTGKPFMELIEDAMKQWNYEHTAYRTMDGRNGLAYTPTRWEELCVSGWCHVFLLVDTSNQITDLTNLSETYEMDIQGESKELKTFTSPKFIHVMSLVQDGEYMTPIRGEVIFDVQHNHDDEYGQYTWIVPELPTLSRDEAQFVLADDGALVGFSPAYPDITYKYLSEEYERKLYLAGETFNPIHRWHQLMDINENDAQEYLVSLPWHLKHISIDTVQDAHEKYTSRIVNTLAKNATDRYFRRQAQIDKRLYERVKDIIGDTVSTMRRRMPRDRPSEALALKEATNILYDYIKDMSYSEQHSIHGSIAKIESGH